MTSIGENEQIGCELFRLDLQDDGRAFDVLRMIKGGIPASIASFILVETSRSRSEP